MLATLEKSRIHSAASIPIAGAHLWRWECSSGASAAVACQCPTGTASSRSGSRGISIRSANHQLHCVAVAVSPIHTHNIFWSVVMMRRMMGAAVSAVAHCHCIYICFSAGYSNFERQGSHDNISVLRMYGRRAGAQPPPLCY